ncbi:hypothetical protein FUAX_52850 (plasmid) [Fulvitalea axinellae]|uniref:Initiator Rep protein WH1 domain-containing protein n=1 Tax=Fulvitalea axinellae TaxID=1182444 RepID=A0AAU9CRS0_9BACT|nr:hypothetical protein FUAX_52850 [Fulvitalea axinellae]
MTGTTPQIRDYRIVKSNKVVNSKTLFTATQQKIVALGLYKLRNNPEQYEDIVVYLSEVTADADKRGGGYYERIKEGAKGLTGSSIQIENEDGSWESLSFVTHVQGKKGQGYILISFHKRVLPLLVNMQKEFTQYRYGFIYRMQSCYSIRIYELMIQYYPNIKHRSFTVERFRLLMNLERKYKKFADFRKNVLDVALKEINALTDINLSYKLKKRGRAFSEIEFVIRANSALTAIKKDRPPKPKTLELFPPQEENPVRDTNQTQESLELLPVEKEERSTVLSPVLYTRLSGKYGTEYLDFVIDKVIQKENVKSVPAYVNQALLKDYYKEDFREILTKRERVAEKRRKEEEKAKQKELADKISKAYNDFTLTLVEKYAHFVTEDDIHDFIKENSSNVFLKKYGRTLLDGKEDPKALYSLTMWFVRKYADELFPDDNDAFLVDFDNFTETYTKKTIHAPQKD